MKVRIGISALAMDQKGRILAALCQWKMVVWVISLMSWTKERVRSNVTPKSHETECLTADKQASNLLVREWSPPFAGPRTEPWGTPYLYQKIWM